MLRIVALTLVVVLAAPLAAADPLASVAVGPRGVVDPSRDPYWVWATISPAALVTGNESRAYDCAAGTMPTTTGSAEETASHLAAWDPTTSFGASSWFPGCVATAASTGSCDTTPMSCPVSASLYATYDVGTGDFYVRATGDAPFSGMPGLPIDPKADFEMEVGGNSGGAVVTDCVGCPPPP